MRYIILITLLIALTTVVGCDEKESMPADNTMNSMDTKSTDAQAADAQSMDEQSVEKKKKEMEMAQSPETMEAPAAATETPASSDAAGAAQ